MKFLSRLFSKWFRHEHIDEAASDWRLKAAFTAKQPATTSTVKTIPTKMKTPELTRVLTYSGDDIIGHSKMEIAPGTVMKITATKKQPVGFRNKKFRVVFCERVSDNAEFYTVNLKSVK